MYAYSVYTYWNCIEIKTEQNIFCMFFAVYANKSEEKNYEQNNTLYWVVKFVMKHCIVSWRWFLLFSFLLDSFFPFFTYCFAGCCNHAQCSMQQKQNTGYQMAVEFAYECRTLARFRNVSVSCIACASTSRASK